MSVAPFPALGRLWAGGGAPAAFVRRDERLRAALERVVVTAEGATPLVDDAAYAGLLATLSLSSLLPTIEAVAPPRAEEEMVRRRRELSGAVVPDDQPRGNTSFASLRMTGAQGEHSSASSVARMNGTPERRSTSVSRASDSAKRLVPATTDALSRRVPPVRHEVDATVRTRVATILSAVEHGTRSRAQAVESEPAQPTCLIELLTKTVQRVEHLMTERTRRTSDRSAPQMQESRGYRTYRPGEDARSALSWPSIEQRNAPMEETTPQVGLRGLAARFGAASPNSPARRVRAPLLVPPNATVTEWPDDQLAALLDDAARRGGVDTAEEAP